MRFYIGFSKKIPIKWIITAILAILAFFGLTKVNALEVSDLELKYSYDLGSNILITLDSNNNPFQGYWSFTNPVSITDSYRYLVFNISEWSIGATDENTTYNWNYFFTIANTGAYELFNSDGASVLCDKHNGYVICPVQNGKTYTSLTINLMAPGLTRSGDVTSSFRVYSSRWCYIYENPANSQNNTIINNQQQIIDSNTDINNSLKDDNTTEAGSSANDFFSDFQIDDSKGITNIVVAPIHFLESLLTFDSTSCSPLNFSLNMADDNLSQTSDLSLPCGSILWSKAPDSIILLYHVAIWGVLGYRGLIGLNKFFNDIINPEKSSEYFMDL